MAVWQTTDAGPHRDTVQSTAAVPVVALTEQAVGPLGRALCQPSAAARLQLNLNGCDCAM